MPEQSLTDKIKDALRAQEGDMRDDARQLLNTLGYHSTRTLPQTLGPAGNAAIFRLPARRRERARIPRIRPQNRNRLSNRRRGNPSAAPGTTCSSPENSKKAASAVSSLSSPT